MSRSLRIHIAGRVQGVGFRYWMQDQARSLKIAGWVRNRRDGGVEAVISGEPEAVEALLSRCRRGPSTARVGEVRILGENEGNYAQFEIRPTGQM
jgi:acylphosphatase